MANKKLYIVNDRMLQWMNYSIQTNIASTQKDWCEQISFPAFNLSQVKRGTQGFTLQHIQEAAKLINGNINWLFNLETNMLRHSKQLSPLELLREATTAIESELGLEKIIRSKSTINKKANSKIQPSRKISS